MDQIWNTLKQNSPFQAETSRAKPFKLFADGDSIKIKIEGRQKLKSISRDRFNEWCIKWFEKGEKRANQYRNNTGQSNATNFAYISQFFLWYESQFEGPDLETLTAEDVLREAKTKVLREVTQRQGQPTFRDQLIKAYGGQCAVTGCKVSEVLEAAHIVSYNGPESQHVQNGLLLRSDIHLLFDCGLLKIDRDYRVHISEKIQCQNYSKYQGKEINSPKESNLAPNRQLLNLKYKGEC